MTKGNVHTLTGSCFEQSSYKKTPTFWRQLEKFEYEMGIR